MSMSQVSNKTIDDKTYNRTMEHQSLVGLRNMAAGCASDDDATSWLQELIEYNRHVTCWQLPAWCNIL